MTKEERAMRRAIDIFNKFAAEIAEMGLFRRQASYRYYGDRQPADRYFYTTKKILHKGEPRYVAGIYRYRKTKDDWKLVKKVGFAKKKKAIEWARKAYQERK